MLHVAPLSCADCAKRHADDSLKAGELVIHDYLAEQRDPTNAERQDTFRRLQAAMQALEAAGISFPLTDQVQANVTLSAVTTPPAAPAPTAPDVTLDTVTPEPIPINRPRHNEKVTAHSRARGTTVTTTVRETETTKKNVSDGEVVEANEAREVDDAPFLAEPNRAAAPRTPAPRGIQPPAAIASMTPKWLHPCTDYVRHTSRHRLVNGVAVCDACEEKLAESGSGGAAPAAQSGFGLA
jgi:hypothetical protein